MQNDWLKQLDLSLRCHGGPDGKNREQRLLEIILVLIVLGVTFALGHSPGFELAMLNLYFLPVTLGGFFLGRYRASVLTLLCVMSATFATIMVRPQSPAASMSLSLTGATLAIWSGVLSLAALLVGTLSDERRRELVRLHESHKTDTLSDALTGVANRRAFDYELSRRLADWNHRNVSFSLLFVDVDLFKKFNDAYGHQAGDAVLREVAQQLKLTVRESDLVARYGGEEIAIILSDVSVDTIMETGERVRRVIEENRFDFEGLTLRLTVSVGAAQAMPGESEKSLIERADVALYTSKQCGRNCAHFHDGKKCEHFGAAAANLLEKDASKGSHESFRDDAYSDPVTGLPSRKVFIEELRRRLAETRRYQAEHALMFIRLDDGLAVKDEDQAAYNKAILVVGEAIQNMMRDSDLVAQYASDQFAVLLPLTEIRGAFVPAERLRRCLAEVRSRRKNGEQFDVTISIGITDFRHDDNTTSILSRTIETLEVATERGGDFACYDAGKGALPIFGDSVTGYTGVEGLGANVVPSGNLTDEEV